MELITCEELRYFFADTRCYFAQLISHVLWRGMSLLAAYTRKCQACRYPGVSDDTSTCLKPADAYYCGTLCQTHREQEQEYVDAYHRAGSVQAEIDLRKEHMRRFCVKSDPGHAQWLSFLESQLLESEPIPECAYETKFFLTHSQDASLLYEHSLWPVQYLDLAISPQNICDQNDCYESKWPTLEEFMQEVMFAKTEAATLRAKLSCDYPSAYIDCEIKGCVYR